MPTQFPAKPPKRKVFISYHHAKDQVYNDELIQFNQSQGIFIDSSVDTGEIDDSLPDESIRCKIRDEYLRDSTVTILLVGTQTKYRKHVDWELYSSMFDGSVNKKSGIIVITLPTTNCTYFQTAHENEKVIVHPECQSWISITERTEFERRYPYLPDRIIDNLLKKEAKISVLPWGEKLDNERLSFLIEAAFRDREHCEYDLSRPMRRVNYNPLS
jgi:hypothetical protein